MNPLKKRSIIFKHIRTLKILRNQKEKRMVMKMMEKASKCSRWESLKWVKIHSHSKCKKKYTGLNRHIFINIGRAKTIVNQTYSLTHHNTFIKNWRKKDIEWILILGNNLIMNLRIKLKVKKKEKRKWRIRTRRMFLWIIKISQAINR